MTRFSSALAFTASLLIGVCLATSSVASDLVVVSNNTGKVLRYGPTGAFIGEFAGISGARGIADDGAGHVYVSSANGSLAKYDEDGGLLDFVATSLFGSLAADSNQIVYVTSFFDDSISAFDFSVSPPLSLGAFVASGSGGLDGPTAMTFGPDEDLYVSSRISGQVLHYSGSSGAFLEVFATPGGNGPQGLTFGPGGDLFVANNSTDLVVRFDGTTGAALGAFATPTFDATDGMTPVFGPDGDLYVSGSYTSDSIERFDGTTGGFIEVFVSSGSGGLDFPTQFIFVPEPGRAAGELVAAAGLAAAARRRRN